MAANGTCMQEVEMVEDNKQSGNPASDPKHRSKGLAAARVMAGDVAALTVAVGLGVRVARARIETCATLMVNAEAALGSRQEALAIDAILNAEPRLVEARTILTATTMLRRIVREANTAKT